LVKLMVLLEDVVLEPYFGISLEEEVLVLEVIELYSVGCGCLVLEVPLV